MLYSIADFSKVTRLFSSQSEKIIGWLIVFIILLTYLLAKSVKKYVVLSP